MAQIKLSKRYKYAGDIMPKLLDIGFDLETANNFLNDIPDTDVEEVRHGEWKAVYSNHMGIVYECTECGYLTLGISDYCICGAKMDGERKENDR